MGRQIFLDKRRQDLFNPTEGNPGWIYYLTIVLQVVYLIGFVFGVSLVLVTSTVTHTHFRPGQLNNNLYSERYNSLWWMALFFASMRFLFFLSMQSMFLYRNTSCCNNNNRGNQGCTVFWMIILFGICALDFIALGINSNYLATCNGKNAAGNPCNDPAWCCLAEVHSVPTNHCPNTLTCPGTIVLEKDKLFLTTFALNVIFVVLELYFILLPMILWFLASGPEQITAAPQEEEEEASAAAAAATEQDQRQAEMALLNGEIIDSSRPFVSTAADLKLRRPPPRTPLLIAAAAAAGAPMVHVTPPTVLEKNTKQP